MKRAAAALLPAVLALALLLAFALQPRVLAPALAWQGRLLQALLPPFAIDGPWLAPSPAGARVGLRAVSRGHLVLHGRAWPPGLQVDVAAPATLPLRPLALLAAGLGVLGGLGRLRLARLPAVLLTGLVLALALLPLVLAGQAWAVLDDAPRLDPAGLLAFVSAALLDGADLVLALVLLALAADPARRAMVLSDHGRTWSARTMRARPDEGRSRQARRRA